MVGDRRTNTASQHIRKRIEEAFGWIKTVAGLRKTKLRGLPKVDWAFTFAAASYDLLRAPKLIVGGGMTAPAGCRLIGRWRIVEADLWDHDYLDLVEPAHVTFDEDGRGEFAFGAVNATMDLEYARATRCALRISRTRRRRHPRDRTILPPRQPSDPQSPAPVSCSTAC